MNVSRTLGAVLAALLLVRSPTAVTAHIIPHPSTYDVAGFKISVDGNFLVAKDPNDKLAWKADLTKYLDLRSPPLRIVTKGPILDVIDRNNKSVTFDGATGKAIANGQGTIPQRRVTPWTPGMAQPSPPPTDGGERPALKDRQAHVMDQLETVVNRLEEPGLNGIDRLALLAEFDRLKREYRQLRKNDK